MVKLILSASESAFEVFHTAVIHLGKVSVYVPKFTGFLTASCNFEGLAFVKRSNICVERHEVSSISMNSRNPLLICKIYQSK